MFLDDGNQKDNSAVEIRAHEIRRKLSRVYSCMGHQRRVWITSNDCSNPSMSLGLLVRLWSVVSSGAGVDNPIFAGLLHLCSLLRLQYGHHVHYRARIWSSFSLHAHICLFLPSSVYRCSSYTQKMYGNIS